MQNQDMGSLVFKNSKYFTFMLRVLKYHSVSSSTKTKIEQGTPHSV